MKSLMTSMLVVLMGVVFYVAPTPAKADPGGPINCGSSCDVITCNSTVCTVYHCENGMCWVIGSYPNTNRPRMPNVIAGQAPRVPGGYCDISGTKACAIEVCANGTCTISLLERKSNSFVPVGTRKDVDKLIDEANSALNP